MALAQPMNTHGGPGRGGGRKARDGASTARVQASLDADTVAHAAELGGGDVSLGLREMSRRLRGLAAQDWSPAAVTQATAAKP